MELKCIHCLYSSKSLIIDKDKALAEVMLDFSKHLTQQHKEQNGPSHNWIQDSSVLASICPTVILIAKHSSLLDSLDMDSYIQEKFSELVDKVQDCLGIEVFDSKPPTTPTPNTIDIDSEKLEPSKLPPESLPIMS